MKSLILLVSTLLFYVSAYGQNLDKQEILCGASGSCPEYLAKILIKNGDTLSSCTGFLTDAETLATSTSCLSKLSAEQQLNCSENIFILFKDENQVEQAECKTVLYTSELNELDSALNRSDISYIKLATPVTRKSAVISLKGMDDTNQLDLWSIDPIDEFNSIIRKQTCQAVHKSYFNPFATTPYSPGMIIAGCDLSEGSTGAPLIDYRGKVLGVVSKSVDQKLIDSLQLTGLLERPLASMVHATNFACAKLLPEQQRETPDPAECLKELSLPLLDKARLDMVTSQEYVKKYTQSLVEEFTSRNQFLKFHAKLSKVSNAYVVKYSPACFKNPHNWISVLRNRSNFTFSLALPTLKIIHTFNSFGQEKYYTHHSGDELTYFQFSPRTFAVTGQSSVLMFNQNESVVFPNVTQSCQTEF